MRTCRATARAFPGMASEENTVPGAEHTAPTNLPGFYPAVYPCALNAPGLPLSDLPPAREQAGTLEAHFRETLVQSACRNTGGARNCPLCLEKGCARS